MPRGLKCEGSDIAGCSKRLRFGGPSSEVGLLCAIPAAEESRKLEVGLVAGEQSYRRMVVEMDDVVRSRQHRKMDRGVVGNIWVRHCIVLGRSSLT